MRRLATWIMASAVAGASAVGGAAGQTCFTMQAEMIHLLSRGDGGDRSRYERAYREQADVIARTERRARDAGCFGGGGFFLFRREPAQACRTLLPGLREMQENLARLDQLRRRAGGERNYRIRELQDMMRIQGCDMPGRGLTDASRDRGRGQGGGLLWEDDSFYSSRGTFRTLCVRSCDGYYFPISFSTVPDQFPQDDQACQAMCPGAQAELYYYRNPGGGPENMTSISGFPYAALPTAFNYREAYDPQCSCRPPGDYSVAAAQPAQNMFAQDSTTPLPRQRPEPGEDPETLANRLGGFDPGASRQETNPATATLSPASGAVRVGRAGEEGEGKVRIVGPVYWGAPEQDDIVIGPVPN